MELSVLHNHQAILSSEDTLLTEVTTQTETQSETDYRTIIANLLNRTQPRKDANNRDDPARVEFK